MSAINLDASGIGQLGIRLGLLTNEQVRECLEELEDKKRPAEDMVRMLERKRYLSPWQGSKLLKGDLDGYFLGGYRILYKIASGSFGRVYRGDDPRTGQVVAVKVLRNKWMLDQQKVDLFLREGKLGMTLRHPNLVSILSVGQEKQTGQYYIAMEFVEGGTLRDILKIRKSLSVDESLRILEECASGLAYAYSKGLTHRDIKPTNILISTDGQAKLVDFGLAEIKRDDAAIDPFNSSSKPSKSSKEEEDDEVAVDRTVDYAGLEKATGQKAGDVRSDIYFLGVVLFECLTGQPLMPPTKDRIARMRPQRYMEAEGRVQREAASLGVPQPMIKLLSRMVAFNAAQRFQTPQALLEGIRTARMELAAATTGGAVPTKARTPSGPRTLFIVEQNAKLQDAFREKFKSVGYRVLISLDPLQALRRYQTSPYHALIVDCGSVGQDGVDAFLRVLQEADMLGLDIGAVLILNEDQAAWAYRVGERTNAVAMVRPVTMKQLILKLHELAPADAEAASSQQTN